MFGIEKRKKSEKIIFFFDELTVGTSLDEKTPVQDYVYRHPVLYRLAVVLGWFHLVKLSRS